MATHSSVLAWRIPGMGEPSGLPPMGSHRVRHDQNDLAAAAAAAAAGKSPVLGPGRGLPSCNSWPLNNSPWSGKSEYNFTDVPLCPWLCIGRVNQLWIMQLCSLYLLEKNLPICSVQIWVIQGSTVSWIWRSIWGSLITYHYWIFWFMNVVCISLSISLLSFLSFGGEI